MRSPLTFLLSYDVAGTIAAHPIGHLRSALLTDERIESAEFIGLALNGSHAVGLIIGERVHGVPALIWLTHVGQVLEIGGLFVEPAYRLEGVATRLTELAVDECRVLGRIPVAVTELGSVAYMAMSGTGAEERSMFTSDGVRYAPWVF